YRFWPLTDAGIRMLGTLEHGFARLPHPRRVHVTETELGGVGVEVITPHGDPIASEQAGVPGSGDALLYLHGGAFLFCGTATHRRLCANLADGLNMPVHSVRYRQLPVAGPGTAVEDAYAAYSALREQLPVGARIVVAGDSAGGFLAAKVCELAALDGIAAPAALVGFSPLLDLDGEIADESWSTRDAFQPASTVRRAQQLWDRGPVRVRGERSMLACAPEVFPPTFFTTAAHELVEPHALTFTERLTAHGRVIETHRWRRGMHAFPVLAGLLPESRRAGELAVDFIRRTLAN
ncbi:MAG: alpha/beta hydrolase, partial [Gordonia sp. (in: high G+C Gram-positive bacteria)]|uniref:alpha/beta hydrolase n=1 Tax=Gordonia sp. (in: high G+C Gram-positive bacteria) TaxID=84139 RepID=UPI003BB4B51D